MRPRNALALLGAALCFVSLPATTKAQTETAKPSPAQTNPAAQPQSARPSSKAASDPLAEVRRSMAVSLVLTLADEARAFRDGRLAARVQMRAADALWEADNDRARELFRRAWDAAEGADREALRRQEEERRKQEESTGTYAIFSAPNLRAEVLRLSARRDRSLGEEFLAKLDEAKKRDSEATAAKDDSVLSRLDPQRPTRAQTERLQLARNLLAEDVERAVQFADPALTSVTMQGLYFLSSLRQKNAKLADERYAAMLSRAALDPASDANTVSLLSSYIFTPSLFITVEPSGGVNSSRFNDDSTPGDVPAALRNAYLSAAAQILLRPLPQPQQDGTSSGRRGLYFIIARVLPLFDQYMPQRSPALRAQMAALSQDVPDDLRNGKNQWLKEGLVPEAEDSADEEKDALDIANSEANPARRNSAYATAALAAARRGDIRAREYADKIDDTEMRKSARAYVDYELVNAALNRKDGEAAARLARTGELTTIQRVWAYTESSGYLAKANPARAAELLEEAMTEANRIGASSAEHAQALVAIATNMYRVNAAKGWEIMSDAVRASNSAEGFTGEDARVTARFVTKNSTSISSLSAPAFDLAGLFGLLARDDFNRAIQLAREFKAEAPRAAATLAIARAVLTDKRR
ncbi:MAG TPA: hypothetical protein VJS44_14795 [Pyrinomonadaceae bacterium]|nr:hypothetical protein [Pyrinomonadaceae bacterium]